MHASGVREQVFMGCALLPARRSARGRQAVSKQCENDPESQGITHLYLRMSNYEIFVFSDLR
jgi:hypothetical protein